MNELNIGRFPPQEYPGAEAINTLCTNLSFSGANIKKIMVTSCHASEGKSYLTMNIMRTMAKLGKTVALVDADLRCSVITSRYGIQFSNPERKMGLAHYLAGKANEEDVLYRTNIDGAYMVPVGREVTNSLQLLNTARFERLLDDLAAQVDYVLVDAPPVGLIIDAAQIAKYCDGTLIVVSYNSVRRQELIDTRNQLQQTGCPILGVVLNMVEYDNYLSKKYYYKSYYSTYDRYEMPEEEEKPARKRNSRAKKA